MGRWERKKNAALTDCALNKGDTRLLMAVRIPPNEMTGIPARTGHTERPDDIRHNGRRRCRIQSGGMNIRRGRMTSGRMDTEEAQKRNRLSVKGTR